MAGEPEEQVLGFAPSVFEADGVQRLGVLRCYVCGRTVHRAVCCMSSVLMGVCCFTAEWDGYGNMLSRCTPD